MVASCHVKDALSAMTMLFSFLGVMDSGICIDDRFGCSGEYRHSCR